MGKILSIVIPAYNVEEYLESCLDSFVSDEILNDIEVIIVDDGSKDGTQKIALRYSQKYPNTFKAVIKENRGHGSTINKGIELAVGKYFKVVDGDDWVDTDELVSLVKYLKKTNCDIVAHNSYKVYEDNGMKKKQSFKEIKYNYEYSFNDIPSNLLVGLSAMNIKTEILQKHNIKIGENMYFVDMQYILFPLAYVETIIFVDLYVYMYRKAIATQSTSPESLRRLKNNHLNVIKSLLEFLDSYTYRNDDPKKIPYIIDKIVYLVKAHYYIYLQSPLLDFSTRKSLKEFDNYIKSSSIEVYNGTGKSKSITLLRKMNFTGYKAFEICYKIFIGLNKLKNGRA